MSNVSTLIPAPRANAASWNNSPEDDQAKTRIVLTGNESRDYFEAVRVISLVAPRPLVTKDRRLAAVVDGKVVKLTAHLLRGILLEAQLTVEMPPKREIIVEARTCTELYRERSVWTGALSSGCGMEHDEREAARRKIAEIDALIEAVVPSRVLIGWEDDPEATETPAALPAPVASMVLAHIGDWGNVIRVEQVEDFGHGRFLDAWRERFGTAPVLAKDLAQLTDLLLDPPKTAQAMGKVLLRLRTAGKIERCEGRSSSGSKWVLVA